MLSTPVFQTGKFLIVPGGAYRNGTWATLRIRIAQLRLGGGCAPMSHNSHPAGSVGDEALMSHSSDLQPSPVLGTFSGPETYAPQSSPGSALPLSLTIARVMG